MLLQPDGSSILAARISAGAGNQYSVGKINSPEIPVRCREGGLAAQVTFNERIGT